MVCQNTGWKIIFGFGSTLGFCSGRTNQFERQLYATSNFSYNFSFSSGQTVGENSRTSASRNVNGKSRGRKTGHYFFNFIAFFFLVELLISIFHSPAFGVLNGTETKFWFYGQPLTNGFGQVW